MGKLKELIECSQCSTKLITEAFYCEHINCTKCNDGQMRSIGTLMDISLPELKLICQGKRGEQHNETHMEIHEAAALQATQGCQ